MLKFTTKGIYGITILLDLACNGSDVPQSTKQISNRTQISEKYLEQILIPLKKTGYIKSFRGPSGGYTLILHPGEINVGKVLLILEGSIVPVDCISEFRKKECIRSTVCVTRLFWRKLHREILSVINQTTLEDLQNKFPEWIKNRNIMYHI